MKGGLQGGVADRRRGFDAHDAVASSAPAIEARSPGLAPQSASSFVTTFGTTIVRLALFALITDYYANAVLDDPQPQAALVGMAPLYWLAVEGTWRLFTDKARAREKR